MTVNIPKIAFCLMVKSPMNLISCSISWLQRKVNLHLDTSGIPSGLKCSLKFNPTEMNQGEKCSGRHKGETHKTKGFPKMGKHQSFNYPQQETCFYIFPLRRIVIY